MVQASGKSFSTLIDEDLRLWKFAPGADDSHHLVVSSSPVVHELGVIDAQRELSPNL